VKKKKSVSLFRGRTEPLNPYVTRQLEIYGGGKPHSFFQGLITGSRRFFRMRIKQPLIALLGLCLGFALVYWMINLQSDGPIRQQTLKLVRQYSLDGPVKQIEKLGRMVQENAEYAVLMDGMERTRVMLEAYPVEGGGYPSHLDELYERAKLEGYWALTKNPFTKSRSREGIIRDFSDYNTSTEQSDFAGIILYEPMGKYNYRIYACDEKGRLIQKNKTTFSLSRP
jgi:hypothetical protein